MAKEGYRDVPKSVRKRRRQLGAFDREGIGALRSDVLAQTFRGLFSAQETAELRSAFDDTERRHDALLEHCSDTSLRVLTAQHNGIGLGTENKEGRIVRCGYVLPVSNDPDSSQYLVMLGYEDKRRLFVIEPHAAARQRMKDFFAPVADPTTVKMVKGEDPVEGFVPQFVEYGNKIVHRSDNLADLQYLEEAVESATRAAEERTLVKAKQVLEARLDEEVKQFSSAITIFELDRAIENKDIT